MKTQSLTLFLILIATSVFGQIPKNAISIEDKNFDDYYQNKKNIPVVKGKILNLSESDIKETKISYSIVTPFNDLQVAKYCNANMDGTFELELEHPFPYQQIWLRIGKLFYAGIYANKDLFIELDAKRIKSSEGIMFNGGGVKYLGTDGELNSYLNNHILFKRSEQLDILKAISELRMKKLDKDAYILKYDSLFSILNRIDNEFIEQNPSEYGWIVLNERQSDYYGGLCIKHWGKQMSPELFENVRKHKPFIISNKGMLFYRYFFDYLSLVPRKGKDIDYKSFKTYTKLGQLEKTMIDSIIILEKGMVKNQPYDTARYLRLTRTVNLSMQDTLIAYNTLQFIRLCDSIFEQPKSDLMKIHLTNQNPDKQKIKLEVALKNIQTKWCREVMEKEYEKTVSKLASINKILNDTKTFNTDVQLGEPIAQMPFGAKLYKVDAMDYKALIANLKNANKGKALVIDFWATWCGPCLSEMPNSKKLQDSSKDLPVEFIYLCTSSNSDIDKWKAKIAEFEIGGTHIFVEQEIESKLMSLFSKSGFPSYVFIDKKGNYKPGAISTISDLGKDELAKLTK